MILKFNTKDSKITAHGIATMENKLHLRFDRYFMNEPEDETVFNVKVVDKRFQFKVELTMTYYGYQLRAETLDDVSAIAALDKCMDAMERQMSKCKTKLSRIKHQVPEITDSSSANDEDSDYEVVKIKSYEMKPLSEQEAIMNMNMLGHNFYVFLHRETNKISVVYKRQDNKYGLIEPR